MALPSIGSVGRITKAAAAGVASGALRAARNTALAGVGAVLSQSPMTAMLLGILGSGVAKGREVYQQLSDHMEGVEEASTKTEANTGKLVTEAQKENTLTRQGHKLFGKMIESLAGIKNALTNQFMRQRRDSVLASMRNFKVPTVGPASTVTPQKEEGGMGFFGKLGLMMLAKRLLEIIGTGLLGAAGAAMAGGALFKGLGSLVWTVGKKAIKFAGPLGLAIGLGMSLFDGIVDAFEEYRNSGSLGESLIKGISSFFSSLTFGLVSKEQVEGIVRPVVETIGDAIRWVADLAISIGEKLKKAVETVEGWYKALVSKIPSWDDLVASFPEWAQEFFRKQDPNAPRAKVIEGRDSALNSTSVAPGFADVSGPEAPTIIPPMMTRDEKAAYESSLRTRLSVLAKEKAALETRLEERGRLEQYSAKIAQLNSAPGLYSSGILRAIENPDRAPPAIKEMLDSMKYATGLMARGGFLTPGLSDTHNNMQSLLLENNKGVLQGKTPKEKQDLIAGMLKEFTILFSRNGGNLAEIELESRQVIERELEKVSKAQKTTEETIREMLSNSPPFLMTIRDAILGDLNTPSLYSEMVDILEDIYEAIVETTRLISGIDTWDPKVIGGNRRIDGTSGLGRGLPGATMPNGNDGRQGSSSSPVIPEPSGPSTPFGGNQKEFYDTMYKTLLEQAKAKGVENPEAIARLGVAQSAIETGYGKRLAGGNNYFGIKDFSGKGGNIQRTREVINGQEVTINAAFRKYGSMEESAGDYIDFLMKNKRYKNVLAAKTPEEAIAAQATSGYATDPRYGSKLMGIHRRGNIGVELPAKQPGTPSPQGESLITQSERLKTLSESVRPSIPPETSPPTQPPVVVAPTVVSPQASNGQPRNISGFSTMPVRNSEWDFRKWNTDSMLRAMA